MTFYCFPHPFFSLTFAVRAIEIVAHIREYFFSPSPFRRLFCLPFLPQFPSLFLSQSSLISFLSLFLSCLGQRLFLKLSSDTVRASYIHLCPFVLPWPAISWRINCFVSFWCERRMNGTSSCASSTTLPMLWKLSARPSRSCLTYIALPSPNGDIRIIRLLSSFPTAVFWSSYKIADVYFITSFSVASLNIILYHS